MSATSSHANTLIHPTAVVDEPCAIGDGTKVWHFCHIMAGATIGKDCSLGQNAFIGGQAIIGNHVRVQNNVSIYDLVTLEDYVFCGPSMVFTNDPLPRAEFPDRNRWKPTLVKRGATIGANATIVCGVTIGQYAFIGAGAVVNRDIPDFGIAVGIPAKVIGWMCRCGTRFTGNPQGDLTCERCGRRYRADANQLTPKD